MKKILSFCIILLIILFTGCNNNHDELYAAIAEQAEHIEELQQTIQEQNDLRQEQFDAIAQLQEETETEEPPFWHGLTESQVRADFFQNAEMLVRNAIGEMRGEPAPLREEDVHLLISDRFVIVQAPDWGVGQSVAFLSYRQDHDNNWEIVWTLTGYGTSFFPGVYADLEFRNVAPPYVISARAPAEARQLTDLETVPLPFWTEWDSYDGEPIEETIQGAALWVDTIRLMREHYGIQIRDLWYEGTTLYVELMPNMVGRFNSGIGNTLEGDAIRRTFEAFPNAADVRFLVLGRRFPAGYLGFDINCTCGGWSSLPETGASTCTCIW